MVLSVFEKFIIVLSVFEKFIKRSLFVKICKICSNFPKDFSSFFFFKFALSLEALLVPPLRKYHSLAIQSVVHGPLALISPGSCDSALLHQSLHLNNIPRGSVGTPKCGKLHYSTDIDCLPLLFLFPQC